MFSCGGNARKTTHTPKPKATKVSGKVPTYGYEIVNAYSHDSNAFTQGLVFWNGFLYEGTGGSKARGDDFFSSLRKVELKTGKVLKKLNLANEYFGEGIVILDDKIYQLTWQSGIVFVYNLDNFKLLKEFRYSGEGWGLTTDGTNLFQSDGTHVIRIINPRDYKTTRTIVVFDEKRKPIMKLNELEYVNGEIWANIWQQNRIARINPENGKLLGWIDLSKLAKGEEKRTRDANVLNGIAFDQASGRLFVTGKKWSRLFEIRLKLKK